MINQTYPIFFEPPPSVSLRIIHNAAEIKSCQKVCVPVPKEADRASLPPPSCSVVGTFLSFLPQKQIDFPLLLVRLRRRRRVITVPVCRLFARSLVAQKQRRERKRDDGPIFSLCSHSRFRRLPFCLWVFGIRGLYPPNPSPPPLLDDILPSLDFRGGRNPSFFPSLRSQLKMTSTLRSPLLGEVSCRHRRRRK